MAVFGYSSATSVLPGSSISFYLSTDVPGVMNLTIERIGTTSVSSTITTTLFTRSLPTTNHGKDLVGQFQQHLISLQIGLLGYTDLPICLKMCLLL